MTTSVEPTKQGWIADDATFGARLALVRQRMGWTNVKEAAVACGLPAENWRRWERGGAEPRRLVTIAMTISSASGCDYLWLVHGPDRGGVSHTHREGRFTAAKVVTVGSGTPGVESTALRRSVRQTRPVVGAFSRPVAHSAL
jgi:hypothetical protein